jgi:hypothetical protein
MPGDLPPWTAVYQQTQHWMRAGVFEILVEDVRSLLREFAGRKPQPTAMIVDSRTLQSTSESGARAGYTVTREMPKALEQEVPSIEDLKGVVESSARNSLQSAKRSRPSWRKRSERPRVAAFSEPQGRAMAG